MVDQERDAVVTAGRWPCRALLPRDSGINGFNLGRYWETEGPQHTLFVPAPRLHAGRNEAIVVALGVVRLIGIMSPRVRKWPERKAFTRR